MNTAVINIKIKPEEKKAAQKVAEELGLPLSLVIKRFLKHFVKTKTITFSAEDETPNARTRALMKQAEENYKKGNTSPAFKTGEEAVAWLEKQGT